MQENAFVPNPAMRRADVKRTAREMLKAGGLAPLALGLLIIIALGAATSGIDWVVAGATNQPTYMTLDQVMSAPASTPSQDFIYMLFQFAITIFLGVLALGYYKMALDLTYGVQLAAPMVLSGFTHFWQAVKLTIGILWRVLLWTFGGIAVGTIGLVAAVAVAAGQAALNPSFEVALDAMVAGDLDAFGTVFGAVGVPLLVGFGFFMFAIMAVALYAQLRYSQAYYLYFYNPMAPSGAIIKQGVDLMKGHYWELFVYSLSFFWWWLLMIPTLGLAYFYVAPYYNVTWALYHRNLVEGWDRQNAAPVVPTDEAGNPQYVTYAPDPNAPVVSAPPAAATESMVPIAPAAPEVPAEKIEPVADDSGEETSGR